MRTNDYGFFEEIANDPEILPWVSEKEEYLDLKEIVENPHNVCLKNDDGGFILAKVGATTYEAHTLFRRHSKTALEFAKEAVRFMFLNTDAMELTTKVAKRNTAAARLAAAVGFRPWFSKPDGWKGGRQDVYALHINDWLTTADTVKEGAMFHLELERGGVAPDHADWTVHDRYAGAAYLLALAGQTVKAAVVYNRWAVMAGYRPIMLMEQAPIFDIGNAKLTVREGRLEVLCR